MADFDLSLAITADGNQAAAELGRVEGGVTKLTAAEFNAAGGAAGLEQAFKKTGAAATGVATKIDAVGKAAKRTQMGTTQLGMQINDLGTQVSMGTNPMNALAMQLGQVGFAMSQMEGKAKGVGMFLAGPWGAALSIAAVVLGAFISKLWAGGEASDNLTEAQKIQKMTTEDLIKSIDAEAEALGKANRSGQEAERIALQVAAAKVIEARNRRDVAMAALEEAKAEALAAQQRMSRSGGRETGASTALMGAGASIRILSDQIAQLERAGRVAEENLRRAQVPIVRRGSEARTDPGKGIADRYQRQLDKLDAEFVSGTRSIESLRKETDRLRIARKAEEDDLAKRNRKPRKEREVSLGDQVEMRFGEDLLAAAEAYRGMGNKNGKGSIATLIGFDPNDMAWCAAFLNGLLKNKGVSGTGSNAARSFLGWGSETKDPRKGDVVVSRRGKGEVYGHVGLYQGQDAQGNVRVLGGNTGRKVGTMTVAQKDILGFRRAPDAAAQFKDAEQEEARIKRLQDQFSEFGERATATIANMTAKAGGMTTFEKWRKDFDALNLLADDLSEKLKDPSLTSEQRTLFEDLRDQAQQAGEALRDDIQAPFRDYMEDQEKSLEMDRLIHAGKEDQAEVIRIIADLEERIGQKLIPEQVAAIRAGIDARKAEQREADIAREKQQVYLDAISETRDAVRGLFDFSGKGFKEFPKRIGAMFEKMFGDMAFEKLFGKFFREMEDQVKGVSIVEDASQKFDAAIVVANTALDNLTSAAQGAANALGGAGGATAPEGSFGASMEGFIRSLPGGDGSSTGGNNGTDIVVTAKRNVKVAVPGIEGIFKGMAGAAVGMAANVVQQMFGGVGQMAGKVKGGKLSDTLGGIAQGVSQFFPQMAVGMAITSGLSKVLGVKNFAGGAFGIGGNLIASLFGFGKAKRGSATINSIGGAANYDGSKKFGAASTGAATSVQGALQSIIEQLGGEAGAFRVSIGQRDGKWRVDPTGRGKTKKKSGAKDFGDDEGAAIAYAIADAIKDGAIKGLSEAVQRALRSNTDVDKALAEAVKVQELELLLGGIGGQVEKQFRDFENVAKERVRLATTYGLDLVKLEKINAEERVKMFEEVLSSRIGAMKDLLNDLNFGDLFEGTPSEKRRALLGEIATARTAADGGDEDAINRLANMERDLIALSRETYGTAGPEFGADLAMARADAERIIALETQRAKESQERAIAQLNAATTQVALHNETNNLLAKMVGGLDRFLGGGDGGAGDVAASYSDSNEGYMVKRTPTYAKFPM